MSNKYGIDVWSSGENAEIDIVFLHGLRGHRELTWTKKDGLDAAKEVLWPKELLTQDIKASRIMSFGYDSGVVHSDTAKVSQNDLAKVAREFCTRLHAQRSESKTTDRPIITIAHSLGGLVAAQAIVLGSESAEGDSTASIASHIRGMIFLGTPFRGSHLAKWADVVRALFNIIKRDTDQQPLKTLTIGSDECEHLRRSFPDNYRRRTTTNAPIRICFFYETLKTWGTIVVDKDSATFDGVGEIIPMATDHLQICKFLNSDEEGYKVLKEKILDMMKDLRTEKEKPAEKAGENYQFNNWGNVINQGRSIKLDSQTNNFGN